jgi:hypothetical protein
MLPTIFTPTASGAQIWRLIQLVGLIASIFFLMGVFFGYLSRHKSSVLLSKRAFLLAACHFAVCMMLAWYSFFHPTIVSLSSENSDGDFHPLEHKLVLQALIILDAPVVLIVWYYPSDGSYHSYAWMISGSAIWSLFFGYIASGLTTKRLK